MTNGTNKVFLICEAAETLSLRNALTGTIAQNFLIYNTYTSASVYERGFMRWASNQLEIGTEHTGGSDRNIVIKRGSITHLTFGSNQITFSNSINFVFGTGSGNKLGTSASQLIGFWNATPIVQPAHADQAAFTDSTGGTAAASLVDVTASHDQAKLNDNFATLAKLVLAMRTALVNSGLMKGAA
jgi:hypothetical protein